MRKRIKVAIVALSLCALVSSYTYGVCFSLRSQYCVTPGSTVGYHTYDPQDPCYPSNPPITASTDPNDIDGPLNKCHLTWQGYPDSPYNRQFTTCSAWVKWEHCQNGTQWEFWTTFTYYLCTDQCTP